MQLFSLTTIHLGPGAEGEPVIVPAETEFTIEDAEEGARLIAIGAAINPEQRIVVPQEAVVPADLHTAVVAELDAVRATLAEATSANEEFNAKHGELSAALDAAHAEIDRLTKALAAAEKKK